MSRSAEHTLKPRRWPFFSAVIVALLYRGVVSTASAAPALPGGANAAQAGLEYVDPNPNINYQRLLELLELLYALLSEPFPESSPTTAESWFNLITTTYYSSGVPANLTQPERAQGRAWITEIKSLMQAIPQMLNPQAAASFNNTLDHIYAELGG